MERTHFRISADLSKFFTDHRSTALIFISDKIVSIGHLENKISKIFQISNFYLTCQDRFLPATEDIRVLVPDEQVCVVPYKGFVNTSLPKDNLNAGSDPLPEKLEKKKKKYKSDEPTTLGETTRALQHAQGYTKASTDSNQSNTVESLSERIAQGNPIKKRKIRFSDSDYYTQEGSKYEQEFFEEPFETNVVTKKTKIKKKPIDKEILTIYSTQDKDGEQVNEYHEIKKKKEKKKRKQDPVEHFEVPKKKKKKELKPEPNIPDYSVEVLNLETESKGHFEEITNSRPASSISVAPINTVTANNLTAIQKPIWHDDSSMASSIVSCPTSVPHRRKELSYRQTGVGHIVEMLRNSDTNFSSPEVNCGQEMRVKRKRVRKRKTKRQEQGFQEIQRDENYEFRPPKTEACPKIHIKFDDDNVTNHNNSEVNNTTNEVQALVATTETFEGEKMMVENLPVKELADISSNTVSEYSQGLDKYLESTMAEVETNRHQEVIEEKTTVNGQNSVKLVDTEIVENGLQNCKKEKIKSDNEVEPMFDYTVFSGVVESVILKQPLMKNMTPRAGDVIAFKALRLGEDYSPTVSSYIIGYLQHYDPKSEMLVFKIISGLDQCKPPEGKFYLPIDGSATIATDDLREFSWIDLIDPRLLFP